MFIIFIYKGNKHNFFFILFLTMCRNFLGMENKVKFLKKSYKYNEINKLIKLSQNIKKNL